MRVSRDPDLQLRQFARQMRRTPTDAERRLWWILRGRRLAGFKFRRQVPIEGFILDFYCVKARLAIELDGGQHGEPKGLARDDRRSYQLEKTGISVLRFWNKEVLTQTHAVEEMILEYANGLAEAAERERLGES
jgi:very-short-patch-repair endonuclease